MKEPVAPADNLVTHWVNVITQYETTSKSWHTRARKIIKRYKDERGPADPTVRFNVLWSNVETLKPFLFAQVPNPEVERRFKDDDPVGRVSSDVLERALTFFMHDKPFGSTMRQAVLDYLLPGRGTVWVRYVPHLQEIEGTVAEEGVQLTDDNDEQEVPEEVVYEEVVPDYVHFEDFGHTPGRTWEEVTGVWRRVFLTREQMQARFGRDIAMAVPLDYTPQEYKRADNVTDDMKKAIVYEIWDSLTKRAIWISKSHPEPLGVLDDPLKLDKFFPCPRPIYATLANDSLIPVPDYIQYQDQAIELDQLTARIESLTRSLKIAGVYDASIQGLERVLVEGVEAKLIPVQNWAAFAEKGGLQGGMSFLPIKEIATVLMQLYEARDKVKQDLYEITGMSDIIRGSTAPQETATAQNIKSHFATMRLDERQREVQRFARNVVGLMGSIIAGHFDQKTLQRVTGVKLLTNEEKSLIQQAQANPQLAASIPPDQMKLMQEPSWDDVMALLRDNAERQFRIDIETDSTIAQDDAAEQQAMVQFMQTFGQMLDQGMQIVQQQPILAEVVGESLKSLARRFKAGRSLEAAIDQAIDKLVAKANQPQPDQPNPDAMKVQQDGQIKHAKLQMDAQAGQQKLAMEAQDRDKQRQADLQMEQIKQQAEDRRHAAELQFDAMKTQMQQQHEASMQAITQRMDQQFEMLLARLNNQTKVEVAEISAGATVTSQQIAASQGVTE